MTSQQFHNPVMLKEVLENLAIRDGEIYVDGTFGAGGYSSAILHQADCKLIAFDRDISVENFVNKLQHFNINSIDNVDLESIYIYFNI